jgi:hypothetical protein
MEDILAALGFRPQIVRRRAGRLSCRLRSCPYRDSVRENQTVVCTLHRGLTRGVLDQVAPAATLTRVVPDDPDSAGCEIDVEGCRAAGLRGAAAGSGASHFDLMRVAPVHTRHRWHASPQRRRLLFGHVREVAVGIARKLAETCHGTRGIQSAEIQTSDSTTVPALCERTRRCR